MHTSFLSGWQRWFWRFNSPTVNKIERRHTDHSISTEKTIDNTFGEYRIIHIDRQFGILECCRSSFVDDRLGCRQANDKTRSSRVGRTLTRYNWNGAREKTVPKSLLAQPSDTGQHECREEGRKRKQQRRRDNFWRRNRRRGGRRRWRQ